MCLFFFLLFLSFKRELPSLRELFSLLRKMMCWRSLPFQVPPLSHLFAVHVFRKKKTPLQKKPQAQPTKKTPSSYIPGSAGKGCWASKSEDIYPELLNARNQVETYCHSPTCKPGMATIPPAAWESGKLGCTNLLWTLRLSQRVAQGCFCLVFNYVIWCNNTSPCL